MNEKGVKKAYWKIWREKNKDKVREYNKKWLLNNPETRKQSALKWNKENPEKVKDTWLKREYGISLENYKKLLEIQNGVCAICEKKQENKNLAIDHNHKTNKIRGLLCNNCNLGLGYLKDDFVLLYKASEYLRDFAVNNK